MGTVQARILKWFAMPFSRGSTQLRDQTQVSHTVSRFFPIWATILLLNISKLCIYDSEYYLLNCVQLFATPAPEPTRLLCPWSSPGKHTGVGCYFLLQGILLTQGSNLGLLHCRWILYQLNHQGSPMIGDYDVLSFHKMISLEKPGKGNWMWIYNYLKIIKNKLNKICNINIKCLWKILETINI